jgi:hypothetical protein
MTTATGLSPFVFHAAVTDLVNMPTIGAVPAGLSDEGLIVFSSNTDDKVDPDPLIGREGLEEDDARLPGFLRPEAMIASAGNPRTQSGIQKAWLTLSDIVRSNEWRHVPVDFGDSEKTDRLEDVSLRELVRSVAVISRLGNNNPKYSTRFDSIRGLAAEFMALGEEGEGAYSRNRSLYSALLFSSLDTLEDRLSAAEAFMMAADVYVKGDSNDELKAFLYEASAYNYQRAGELSDTEHIALARKNATEAWMRSLTNDRRRETRVYRIYRAMTDAWPHSWESLAILYGMYADHIAKDRHHLEAARSKIRFVWKRADDVIFGKEEGPDATFWKRMGNSLRGAMILHGKAGTGNARPELLEDLADMANGLMEQARKTEMGKAKGKKRVKKKEGS